MDVYRFFFVFFFIFKARLQRELVETKEKKDGGHQRTE